MKANNQLKNEQLGMSHGAAANILRKNIMFSLLKVHGYNVCYHCEKEIENAKQLSIEHKTPWLYSANPRELFFDLNNIAFSHLRCNSGAARKTRKTKHPSEWAYAKGCRCEDCREIRRKKAAKYRARKRITATVPLLNE